MPRRHTRRVRTVATLFCNFGTGQVQAVSLAAGERDRHTYWQGNCVGILSLLGVMSRKKIIRQSWFATCFECVSGLFLPFILMHFENCLSADGLKYVICKDSCLVDYGTYSPSTLMMEGTAVAQWLRCCGTNRKVACSIPAGVIGIFHWHKILPIALRPWGWLSP